MSSDSKVVELYDDTTVSEKEPKRKGIHPRRPSGSTHRQGKAPVTVDIPVRRAGPTLGDISDGDVLSYGQNEAAWDAFPDQRTQRRPVTVPLSADADAGDEVQDEWADVPLHHHNNRDE